MLASLTSRLYTRRAARFAIGLSVLYVIFAFSVFLGYNYSYSHAIDDYISRSNVFSIQYGKKDPTTLLVTKTSSEAVSQDLLTTGAFPLSLDELRVALRSNSWLDEFVSKGTISKGTKLTHASFDIIYTWVNGSEMRHLQQREEAQLYSPVFNKDIPYPHEIALERRRAYDQVALERRQPDDQVILEKRRGSTPARGSFISKARQAKRFRNYDELRYSIRSVEMFLKNLKKVFIIATDFADGTTRSGQIPQWLALSNDRVRMVHHSQLFQDPRWVPSFNSFGIESQLPRLSDVNGQFLYMNDDMFIGRPLSPNDIWNPLYGFVFRLEAHLKVKLISDEDVKSYQKSTIGLTEWEGIQYANYLLSKRFGMRSRVYSSHLPHSMSMPILREMATVWSEELVMTASHRFRGEGQDIHLTFMFTHYVMERHREALLRSYLLYRADSNHDGFYSWDERKQIVDDGLLMRDVVPSNRDTKEAIGSILQQTNLDDDHTQTTYSWSSADGFAFHMKSAGSKETYSQQDPPEKRECRFIIDRCLGEGFAHPDETYTYNAMEIFQRVAFQQVDCGDCLIAALLSEASKGVEPMLPETSVDSSTLLYTGSEMEDSLYQLLGLGVKHYQELKMPSNIPKQSLRDVAIYSIQRYAYVVGSTPAAFANLYNPMQATKLLMTDVLINKPALYCINDDLETSLPKIEQSMSKNVQGFLQSFYPIPNAYELDRPDGQAQDT